jgi:hypothetical protein
VAATHTQGQDGRKTPQKVVMAHRYDENHSEPARLRASNAGESAAAPSNPVKSG